MASSSKPVTATILMILVDQGKLSLDDPVEKYLPEFKGITINGRPPVRLPTVRHLLCNMSGLPGDFLAESLLKRLRNGAGKAQDEIKGKELEKGNSAAPFRRRGKPLAGGFRARAGERGPGDRARSRVSLLHDGFQRGGPGGRSGGPPTVRGAEPNRAVRANGYEQHPLHSLWLAGTQFPADALERREPIHHGRRRYDLDARRLRRVLSDAFERWDVPRTAASSPSSRRRRCTLGRPSSSY